MVKSLFRFVVIFLLSLFWTLHPIPFEVPNNKLNGPSMDVLQTVRGGFEPKNPKQPKQQPKPLYKPTKKNPQVAKTKKGGSSSQSNPKKLTYKTLPDSNPGSSSNPDFGSSASPPVDSDNVISDPGFWDGVLGDSDEDEESTPSPTPQKSQPTGQLTKKEIQEHDETTSILSPTYFNDFEKAKMNMKSKPLKKMVYAHGYEAGVSSELDLIPCPIQTDPNKHQRENCVKITDKSIGNLKDKILDYTTSTISSRVKMEMPMPYFKSQMCIAYMDLVTGDTFFFHTNGGLWGYKKYGSEDISTVIANAKSVKYAKNYSSNNEL